MIRLTPGEEQIMLRLWKLEKASVQQIVDLYTDKSFAYNTISTFVRILERKKFIKHKQKGRGYIYMPKVSKEEYREFLANHLLEHYFDNSKQRFRMAFR